MHLGNALKINKDAENEQGISQHLPYAGFEQEDVLLTYQEDRIRFWKLLGLPIDSANAQVLNEALHHRMTLFGHLPYATEFRVYHTLLRMEQPAIEEPATQEYFAKRFLSEYYADFSKRPLYSNEHYLSLVHRLPLSQRKNRNFFNHKQAKDSYAERKQQAMLHIDDASRFVEQQLSSFGIERLSEKADGSHSVLEFLSKLLNWQTLGLRSQRMEISHYLPKVRLHFGERAIEICDNTTKQSHYATMIGVKGFATTETWPGLLDGLLTLPMELCLTQSFTLIPTQQAREHISLHQRRLQSVADPDKRGSAQLEDALGAVVAGDYSLGWHQLNVMVISKTLSELEDKVAAVQHELLQCGLIPVRETLLTEPLYWSQFPGNHHYLFRKLILHSGNMACMASFHSKTTGERESHWGKALLLLRTPQRSSYWFNFHVKGRDIGDTLILGEKGSGKTLLLTTLATAALQYQPRIFFFDKDFGAECWFHAVNGNHSVLGTGERTGLNPLQLPDTPSNRRFLHQWLRSLLEAFGPPLNEAELTCVHQAIQHNYEHLREEQRSLTHLQSAFGTGGPGSLRNRLQHWHSEGEFAFYFDNPRDNLTFDNPVTGFEMHYLLQDNQAQARLPVLLYLFHRIRLSLECGDRRPTLIILDEAWSLLSNDFFAKEIKNWLLTLRKLNAITIFATQNPSDILNHTISPVLVAETVTKIIYRPNTPTNAVYRDGLHLTEGEYQALCQIPSGSRAFLIKQPDHAIVAQCDLTSMKAYIPLLSSRPRHRQAFLQMVSEHKEDWLTRCLHNEKGDDML